MKALTLTQPWASLVAIGAKQVETRSWSTNYRGPLAIHAAKGFPKYAQDFTYEKVTRDCLLASSMGLKVERSRYSGGGIYRLDTQLPRGSVLARCHLVACVRTEEMCAITAQEMAFGDYSAGRFAWFLEGIERLSEPVLAKGSLGLWEWPEPCDQPSDLGIPGEPCICALESSSICPKHGPIGSRDSCI